MSSSERLTRSSAALDTTTKAAAAGIGTKDKLAALREKRRIREAGSTVTAAPVPAANNARSKLLPKRKVEEESPNSEAEEIDVQKESGTKGEADDMQLCDEESVVLDTVSSRNSFGSYDASEVLESVISNHGDASKTIAFSQQISELTVKLNALESEKSQRLVEIDTMKLSVNSLKDLLSKSKDEGESYKQQLKAAVDRENQNKLASENSQQKSRESDLEAQVNELMDTLEILTLDKEQLVMDNELLQARIDEGGLSEAAATSTGGGQSGLSEENTKLREALRRLHTQSTSDRSQLEILNKKQEEEEKELEFLRDYQIRTESELTELRDAVDAASSYEFMIESLTEKNLKYSQVSAQLETTVRDLEEQQELSEELDQQQRSDLDLMRKKLDSANIQISERDTIINNHVMKIEELKTINDKFRRHGMELQAKTEQLRGQVTVSELESDRMIVRAREAASSQLIQAELEIKVQDLTAELNKNNATSKQLQAVQIRMKSIFGSSSLYSTENARCLKEVSTISCATLSSSISKIMLKFTLDKLIVEKRSTESQGVFTFTDIDENGTEINKVHSVDTKQLSSIESNDISNMMIMLRATCLCWQSAGCVLADTEGDDVTGILSATATSLHALLDTVKLSYYKQNNVNMTAELSHQNEKIFKEIEIMTIQIEKILSPILGTLGVPILPPTLSLSRQTPRRGPTGTGDKHSTSVPDHTSILSENNGNSVLSQFHISCQSSYFALGCDLYSAFINSKVNTSKSHSSSPTSLPSPTATSSTGSSSVPDSGPSSIKNQNYNSESSSSPKGIPVPSPHAGAISDLCRTIRMELDTLGLFVPGGILKISSKAHDDAVKMKGIDSSSGSGNGSGSGSNLIMIRSSLVDCLEQLQIMITFGINNVDEIAFSPAQLRACLSTISDIKTYLAPQNLGPRSAESNVDQIVVINLISEIDIDMMWQLLLNGENDLNENSNDDNIKNSNNLHDNDIIKNQENKSLNWYNITNWRKRSKIGREVLISWEKSQTELISLKSSYLEIQKELKSRVDELRAAKSAYADLNNLVLKSPSSSNKSLHSLLVSENNSIDQDLEGSVKCLTSDQGDVVKLKKEIEVLSSALSVLEIQFEGAERENRRIRNAGRVADSGVGNPSKVTSSLAEMLKVWRCIASHRLMGSMLPLPDLNTNSQREREKSSGVRFIGSTNIGVGAGTGTSTGPGPGNGNGMSTYSTGGLDMSTTPPLPSTPQVRTSIMDGEASPSSSVHSLRDSHPTHISVATAAKKTYRELRMLRSTVRVPSTGPKGMEEGSSSSQSILLLTSTALSRKNKEERANLIENFSQSILQCGGSVIV